MANLTIRNITTNAVTLITVERFEAKAERTSSNLLSNVTSSITGFLNATETSSKQLLPTGSPHQKDDDLSIRVEPFTSQQTDVRSADPDREVIRLTFKIDDQHYQTDVPSPSSQSAVLEKLDGGPLELTAVYVPTGALLAIFSSAKLHAWMHELHDEWPLSLLSIPGTHNSPTCHKALPSVRCQAVNILEQLRNGVRFFDIRVSVNSDEDTLTLVHAVFPISLTGSKYFSDMLNDIYQFLEENPSETLLMSVKREGTGKGTDANLGKYLKESYADKKKDRWFTEPKIPTLGAARGRIVLIRRFGIDDDMKNSCWDGRGWGIDAGAWPDNCEDGKCGDHFRIQDFYEISESQNIEKKIEYSRGQLERAAEQAFLLSGLAAGGEEPSLPPFFVNFLSASNFFNANCWPERIAAKVNPAIVEYLCIKHGEEGKGPQQLKIGSASTGIVVTDWVGANNNWDLIRCIVGMNARLQLKR